MIRKHITSRIINLEWHYVRQRRQGILKSAHMLARCQRIIERMEMKGWLP